MRWTYIQRLSTSGLRESHQAIREALQENDRLLSKQKKYGVREFPDFREEIDEIERELDERKEKYVKIIW